MLLIATAAVWAGEHHRRGSQISEGGVALIEDSTGSSLCLSILLTDDLNGSSSISALLGGHQEGVG